MPRPAALGLTIIRIGLGGMMMFHGYPKVLGGDEKWEMLGGAMAVVGITAAPVLWGAAAAFTELIGGLFLALGFLTRPMAALLLFTMFVAAGMHLAKGDGVAGASHAIEDGIVFLGLLLAGGGPWAVDRLVFKKKAE
ncbi:MAG: putative oxidoreductase [Myxococcota bacterium]|jgi:putative oxidoreductase